MKKILSIGVALLLLFGCKENIDLIDFNQHDPLILEDKDHNVNLELNVLWTEVVSGIKGTLKRDSSPNTYTAVSDYFEITVNITNHSDETLDLKNVKLPASTIHEDSI